ncbi:hypothetical protein [Thermococcus sp.]|uniref:hypothetical protein n=1 Tax=Thermococcus sp. TaxID=35749 RepID=UPI00260E7BEA|nr:hypothetical protein [Thermococcus sp.]
MEAELRMRFELYVERGDRLRDEERYEDAFEAYFEALITLASLRVYADTGMLVPAERLIGFLGKYPKLEDALKRFSGVRGGEKEARALREELERLRGMMTLPSPER